MSETTNFNEQLTQLTTNIEELTNKMASLEEQSASNQLRTAILSTKSEDKSETEYKSLLNSYLRKGSEEGLKKLVVKSMHSGESSEGGFFLARNTCNYINQQISLLSPLRKLASIETITTDSLELLIDQGGAGCGWAGEQDIRNETSTPTLVRKIIQAHEMYAQPKATQKLIDDAGISIEAWVSSKVSETFAKLEGHSFIHGDGQGKPRGILSYAKEKNSEISSFENKGELSSDILIGALMELKAEHAAKASFLMHRSTIQQLRMLKNNGMHIWQPSLSAENPDTLLGIPVIPCDDMPIYAPGNTIIALGDFKSAYKIVDRQSIKLIRDPYTEKPFVKFYATKRLGADVVDGKAIKLITLSK